MDVQTLTFLIVGLSFALYIGIAIWARAGSTKEFYVAGGGVPPLANGMATAADWMSAASFISMAGIISFAGYDGGVYLMGWTGGYVLLAMCLAPYLRKFGKFTVPDFIGDRYYSRTARLVAIFCAIFICFTYIAGQMRGVGVVFSRFLEVEIETGVYIGMVIVFFYAVLGGMKGITYTQVAQYCVLVFAYLVPAIFISMMMTGHFLPQTGFGATLIGGEGAYVLDKLDGISSQLGFSQYTEGSKSMIDVFAITGALMVGTAGLPHVIVRFFTVPRVKDTRISAAWTLVFIAIVYTTAPAVAAFARVNMVDTINGKDGSGTEYAQAPTWIKNWERTGLITFNDKNGDGKMFYTSGSIDDPNSANEVDVDRDIMVLANPEIANLPAWVIALVAAGGIAAALSTTAGLLLVISTSVSHDLLKRTLKPNISDKQELLAARLAAMVAIVISAYFGINPPGFVASVVAFAFGLAAASFFPAIIMGIFSKAMNREGAIAGMVTGIGFTAGYIIYFKFVSPELNSAEHWFLGISPEGIGLVGMIINFAVAAIVLKFTKPTPLEIQQLVEGIRNPKGSSEAHDH
ncbi:MULTISPECIES: sodium:solute symporter family protein [Pseudoalteromonas]|uniref:Sodium/solute symporter family protein n=1 Tax=Pseudoalteromonas translucida (strain TAC 125) TaxID=326442 RepID=Q3ILF8_PSET1|nr:MULTISPECIES: sodium:solute symporter family protein [Pseudoalteromonas]MBB1370243.1 cation acetate symporter [Pseudoalteromonas sp. SR45-4]MBB1405415.1 cation acetate symporter [Pseudoalteromonas sp. SG44-5]MBH0092452.1 cation acetate symporter [Pseudoalteromonas sp. SCQQ13]NYR12531.1 cation acetate symporter [Pseudoalteromonas sp. MIP2626]PCC11992.1 cation acetate symporter [Pseudoalteromonas sp. JB197]|tara:strand:+ start:20162 stop:21886 length:1725 start_codon:yes stop_codon:yes gene_type:complete